ncbi:hypothetical protein LAZ67_8001483 [Cordylochernes scorpioides]|uniref:Transposase Tc1-like domain-containing protein n=1 Tax=Cordylochernes scorpioides TaxID=51811 RepID=A0ABY6KQR7_9ARAC|nr:hypothetical protein LAZ67_8001483 [Cordylochernes scorpioides]
MPGHRKRRQFKQTDPFTRGMVIGLKRAGWSIRQIAADTHLGASTVHRLNVGATRVTSARVDRRILRQAVAAPQATCTAILQHVQDTLDHSISTRTISRRLVANGLHSCRPLRRLPLTPPNRRQRLEWCRARSTWMTEWHRVVFSDESRFCLSSDSRRVRVWRRRHTQKGPIRQQLWNAPPCDNGTMTAQRYVDDVLRPVTLPYLQGPRSSARCTDAPWPPYSPDLSPIEHVWDIIGRRLHALPQPRSEDELWQLVERKWRAIPQDAIRTLIDSLPRRVAACIAHSKKWVAAFKLGRISTENEHRPGRPVDSVTQENIDKIYVLVMLDKRMTVRRIEETLGILKTTVDKIMRQHLGLRKLSARWVPKLLTPDQKTVKKKLSSDNLALFKANTEEFVNRFVTMDETWAHHFTPESKQQSMQWRHSGSPPPRKPRQFHQQLATCEDMLEMTITDPEWNDKIITGDETWVYGYDPETKRQSAE